ncbi:uncharacterized protein LOC134223256 [Armigeres subalbatus]|uniref:uncharacterized protein LOC134223256 n=1 Tax=Armigeres subalbatus TaxID=124917 RepID=UPI002ED2C205
MSDIPCRNPLKYCRLCLSQEDDLILLESHEKLTPMNKLLLQKLFHYMKITFHNEHDYPSAICVNCLNRFNNFHNYRRSVVRNHNAVKTFRRLFPDEFLNPSLPEEEEPTIIELIDDNEIDIKQEVDDEDSPMTVDRSTEETIKEVDVYHLDGELRTVVVKEEKLLPEESETVAPTKKFQAHLDGQLRTIIKEEKLSPVKLEPSASITNRNQASKPLPTVAKKNPQVINSKITILKRPQGKLLNAAPPEKRQNLVVGAAFSVVKCSHCRAVFRNRENLRIHEKNDHWSIINKPLPTKPAVTLPGKKIKPLPPNVTLYKCNNCTSSFIHLANYEHHMKNCKPDIPSKLNHQTAAKRTAPAPVVVNEVVKAAIAKIGGQVQIKSTNGVQIKLEETEDQRIRCPYCPLTYKTKYFLKKHMLDVHKIDDYEDVFFCHVCKLNYSCDEDLQLHNRAIHRFQCKQCLEDFRTCLHAQTPNENGINKG